MPIIFTPKHYKISKKLKKAFLYLSLSSWIAATLLLFIPIFPHILYRLSPNTPTVLAQNLGETTSTPSNLDLHPSKPLPPFDETLPKENRLIIKSLGIDGIIHEGGFEEALIKGVWRESKFGTPNSQLPTILASHRWGYLNWTNTFRRHNSFYNLPKLDTNDQIEIIWEQRKYIYNVYKSETGETITDYSADLILYTCQLWDSPIRIFRYANRTN